MANLPEHAAPESPQPEGDNYIPSDQDKKDLKLVEKLFEQAKKGKSKYDEKWNDYYNFYRGRQWKEQRPSYRHSEVINLIFREIQSSVPIIMDSRPKFEYMPQEPTDFEFAEIMNQVCEADWDKNNWLEKLTEVVYDGHIFGSGLASMCWDKDADFGLGAARFESEDVFYLFPDPNARNVNEKCGFFIKAEPVALEKIKRDYPNGKYVKSDVINLKKADLYDQNKVRFRTPSDSVMLSDGSSMYDPNDPPQALVITCWLDSSYEISEEEVQENTADGSVNVKYVQKKTYPKGKKIVLSNKVVLESGENEYEDGKFPFARFQNYLSPRQFWGISDIEALESPQRTFNKIVSFALDVMTLMGNPIWLVPTSAGVDSDNIFNQPGLILEFEGQQAPVRQEGVQLQPYVLQLIDRLKLWFDDVSGSNDVSRGAKPEGVTAASAIQSLQEAAQTRLRQKSRNLDSFLQDFGQLYASRVLQYYTAPRVFRLTNKDGSQKFFKFHVDNAVGMDGSTQKVARYRPFQQDAEGNYKEGEEKSIAISGSLDLKINTGSSLGFVKDANKNAALQLFDRQIIDAEEVLKTFEYPNWEAVLARVNEQKAQMAQAQAAQGQPA